MTHYWFGKVNRISEHQDFDPDAELTLIASWTDAPSGVAPLPRAGERFWMVDDETFRRLVSKDA